MSSASAIADAVVHIPSTSEKTIAVLQDLYRDKVIGVVHLIFDKLRIDPVVLSRLGSSHPNTTNT